MMKTIAFFNNKGGVGKTSLAYHVSWMLKELGSKVLSVDLDPQANLTGMFINEYKIEEIMDKEESIYSSIEPLMKGTGDIKDAVIFDADEDLGLLPGDLKLSGIEAEFSNNWSKCLDQDERAFRITTAFSRLITSAGESMKADWAVIDMGPNLGSINRSVLIASDYVVFPLSPDLFSYQGLKNVGEFLNKWRSEWEERKKKKPQNLEFTLPEGRMIPLGYIIMRHSMRHDRPVKSYKKWMDKMPDIYKNYIKPPVQSKENEYLLDHLKDYRSLMPMAQEKTKPIFLLKPGDGAIGAHYQAVQSCYNDFKQLTHKIISAVELNEF